jgi:hypothetical protein
VPDLPKPPIFHGTNQDVVEDKLFVFENYLRGSKIPEDTWTNYIMPLLADKALSAWTAVAMPMSQAGLPLPWSLFRSTMLSSFAHPDRQHEAREMLHKVAKKSNQSVNDYVRHFNSLVQRSGNPAPSATDQIMFFHAGLLPFMKDKTATNPATAMFWTELDVLQIYAINVHTHGTHKPAPIVPAFARTIDC